MGETREKLRGLAGIVRELQKIQTSAENLKYIAEHGAPRPRESTEGSRTASRTHGQASEADDPEGTESSPSRRERVLNLLGQQPRRSWKVRDIARALQIENVKSLRTSMDEYVRGGVVHKNHDTSTYFVGESTAQTFF
ncbi:hypothetical protein [Kitasatospora sp. NPDC092286]|uniref:hypothetical protein n=1 Tax=Kitasatospora sp. NPDC092286 TaxID=3364087 RepID=UPI00381DB011